MQLKNSISVAAKYWEPKRIVYNLVLAAISVACWGPEIISQGPSAWVGGSLVLFAFALIANALYCLAYPIDVVLQATPINQQWQKKRWVLFGLGMIISCAAALQVLLGDGIA